MKKPFLEGATINLRPLSLDDAKGDYVNWFNDAEVCQHNAHHTYPYNRKLAEQYIKDANRQKHTMVLAITNKKGTHIGNVSLQSINYISRSAEFAIIIGNKRYWGKGVAKEAGRLLLKHGFGALNLHRIYCGTSANNIAMQKVALALGMRKEGRRRDAIYKNGMYADIIEYGILKKDFKS
ncbi:GNAT family N-acetyltransferase [Candidatus Kaiserbacteria bacterium]|nr:GNAT family N-acetyltransferase [Candidatus Kaiserbacteria bacterium]